MSSLSQLWLLCIYRRRLSSATTTHNHSSGAENPPHSSLWTPFNLTKFCFNFVLVYAKFVINKVAFFKKYAFHDIILETVLNLLFKETVRYSISNTKEVFSWSQKEK